MSRVPPSIIQKHSQILSSLLIAFLSSASPELIKGRHYTCDGAVGTVSHLSGNRIKLFRIVPVVGYRDFTCPVIMHGMVGLCVLRRRKVT